MVDPWEPAVQWGWVSALFMLVTPGTWMSLRFPRRCNSGGRSRIKGIQVLKLESQKRSLHRRQKACWKETFYSRWNDASFWPFQNYPEVGILGGATPEGCTVSLLLMTLDIASDLFSQFTFENIRFWLVLTWPQSLSLALVVLRSDSKLTFQWASHYTGISISALYSLAESHLLLSKYTAHFRYFKTNMITKSTSVVK